MVITSLMVGVIYSFVLVLFCVGANGVVFCLVFGFYDVFKVKKSHQESHRSAAKQLVVPLGMG